MAWESKRGREGISALNYIPRRAPGDALMGDTLWAGIRWRICLQFILWSIKIAPAGDAKGALIDANLSWIEAREEAKETEG